VARTRGAADVSVEISEGSGELRVEVDREALASHGATVADVQEAIELAMGTRVAPSWSMGRAAWGSWCA
jgi:cobalt-zinc-cadmium resistance protein CzcA